MKYKLLLVSEPLEQDQIKGKRVSVVGSHVLNKKSEGTMDNSSKVNLSHDASNDKIMTTGAKLEADDEIMNQTKRSTQTIGNFER